MFIINIKQYIYYISKSILLVSILLKVFYPDYLMSSIIVLNKEWFNVIDLQYIPKITLFLIVTIESIIFIYYQKYYITFSFWFLILLFNLYVFIYKIELNCGCFGEMSYFINPEYKIIGSLIALVGKNKV